MRAKVPSDGKMVTVKEVFRGPPVIYSKDQWLDRERVVHGRFLMALATVAAAVGGPLYFYLLFAFTANGPLMSLLNVCVYALAYVCTMALLELSSRREARRSDGFSGLFEVGLQVRPPMTKVPWFFPYKDIVGAEVRRSGFLVTLDLQVHDFKRTIKLPNMVSILGEWGLVALHRALSQGQSVSESPKLVIYGGTKSTSDVEDESLLGGG